MKSTSIALAFVLVLAQAVSATAAETLFCPDLRQAVQVGSCPSESELQYTFNGYCSDNRRMYQQDTAVCTNYQEYRKLKNIAHWESADGTFTAYLSCALASEQVKAARASRIAFTKRGTMGLLACSYGEEITFTYRSHQACQVEGDGDSARIHIFFDDGKTRKFLLKFTALKKL